MVSLSDVGQLIQVPIEQVESSKEFTLPAFQVIALSEKINEPEFRNWLPVLVQELSPRRYRTVCNSHILAAMALAGQEYVWVAVVPNTSMVEEHIKLFSGQLTLKMNICVADHESILEGLLFIRQKWSKFSKLDVTLASERIAKAPGRISWRDLQPLIQLKCGFTKTNIKELNEVFHTIPKPIEIHPIVLNSASESELRNIFESVACLPNTNLANIDISRLAQAIYQAPERQYWRDLKPLTKIKNGLSSAKLKGLEKVLVLEPKEPPIPNTIRYLLEIMSITELKSEAKYRNIPVHKGVKKSELVDLLSQPVHTP